MGLEPVLTVGDVNFKGHFKLDCALHATHEQRFHVIEFGDVHELDV